MADIQVYMAVRERMLGGITNLASAVLDVSDLDITAEVLDRSYLQWLGTSADPPLNAVELLISKKVDDGEEYPGLGSPVWHSIEWVSQTDLALLPNSIPRELALHLAMALKVDGQYATMVLALEDIFATKTFI
jgi:hypothetical protein